MGNITNWVQQADAAVPTVRAMQYDPVNQLLNSTTFSNTVAGTILKQYAYAYDLAGNRTSEQIVTTNAQVAVSQSSYNNVNQVTNRIATGGPALFAGTISRPGTVTVNSVPATMSAFATNFAGYAGVNVGTNVVAVAATDYGNHSRTNNFQVVVTNNGVAETFFYDLNGNLTNLVTSTSTNSYQWDGANRLVTIIQISTNIQTSLFAYDGVGRRIQDIEKTNGTAYVTNKFIWDGQALAEQRDSTGSNVTRRFFGEGEQLAGTDYYFTRDHLGSVREMTDSSGTIQGRYDYDPYGRQTLSVGTMSADFGFGGMFVHGPSGLNLTFYRAYSADLGRWLSRDPIQELGGINLYGFVGNGPIDKVDSLGLYVSFTTTNGVTTVVQDTGPAFTAALQADADSGNQVTTMVIAGHGAPGGGVATLDKDANYGLSVSAGHVFLTGGTNSAGKMISTDITGLLKKALAPNATIHLNACDTANPSNNLAKDLSQTLPNTQVTGYPGTVYDPGFLPGFENFNAGAIYNFGSSEETYVNGKKQ